MVCRGRTHALDLAAVELSGSSVAVPNPFMSFLSVSWGLIGDVDIEADFLRPQLGAGRFAPWFARRMQYPRLYSGTLHYRPLSVSTVEDVPPLLKPVSSNWVAVPGPFLLLWACNVAWMTMTSLVAPTAKLADGMWQLVVIHGPELAACSTASDLRQLVADAVGAGLQNHSVRASCVFRALPPLWLYNPCPLSNLHRAIQICKSSPHRRGD